MAGTEEGARTVTFLITRCFVVFLTDIADLPELLQSMLISDMTYGSGWVPEPLST